MPNPLVAQGVLNRLRGSVVVADAAELNVTAPFLGKAGIRISLEGETTLGIPTMTGVVQSPEPYQMALIQISLLRTQQLAELYKRRAELNTLLGQVTVRPDSAALSNYTFLNCALVNPSEVPMDGQDPAYAVSIRGIYYLNSSLFDAA
jgi:hypothetical protein